MKKLEKDLKSNLNVIKMEIKYTKEFVIPGMTPKPIWNLHIERYKLASRFVKNSIVLDAACGTGFGSQMMLEGGAKSVIGIDINEAALMYAKEAYDAEFLNMDVTDMKFDDNTFDVVVSFSTIEHLKNWKLFIESIKRILKPSGILIISVSNHKISLSKYKYHLTNFKKDEFIKLMKSNFSDVKVFGQGKWFFSFPGRGILDDLLNIKRDISSISELSYPIDKEPYELILISKNEKKA